MAINDYIPSTSITFVEVVNVIQKHYPLIEHSFTITDTPELIFREWNDASTGQPSVVPKPTLIQCIEWIESEPKVPDWNAFRDAVMAIWNHDPIQLSQKMKDVPGWYEAAKSENVKFLDALTKYAKKQNFLTPTEYESIKQAAIAHHISLTL